MVMRVLAFFVVVFVFLGTLQLITWQKLGYADTFQLLVEPVEPDNPPPSCSPGSYSRSFYLYFKALKNYFNVEVDSKSLANLFVNPPALSAPSSASDITSILKFSLEAKRDFQGQIFAKFYDSNGLAIQKIPEANSFTSTPSSYKHYPSFTQENTLDRFEQWQWRKKEKELLFFRVPRNTCKMEVFFEESR
jgi:hypothetical protein